MKIRKKSDRTWEVDGNNDTYTVWIDLKGVYCCTCPFACRKYSRECRHIKGVIDEENSN